MSSLFLTTSEIVQIINMPKHAKIPRNYKEVMVTFYEETHDPNLPFQTIIREYHRLHLLDQYRHINILRSENSDLHNKCYLEKEPVRYPKLFPHLLKRFRHQYSEANHEFCHCECLTCRFDTCQNCCPKKKSTCLKAKLFGIYR